MHPRRPSFRTLVVVALGALPLAFAVTGSAAPTTPGAAPPPVAAPRVDLPARIVAMKRIGPPRDPGGVSPNTGGPLHYEFEIAAPTAANLTTNLVIANWKLGVNVKLAVNLQAGTRTKTTWKDDQGLVSSCNDFGWNLSLEGVEGSGRVAEVTPNCTFTTEAVDPTAPIPPDTKQAQRANKVYYTGPTFAFACVDTPGDDKKLDAKMSAAVVNKSTTPATAVSLKIDGPGNATSKSIGSLAPNESKQAEVPWIGVRSGDYVLSVTAAGPATYQMGWRVKVGVSCSPSVKLK